MIWETGTGPLIGKSVEVEALHKDGYEFPVEISISALKLAGKWHAVGLLRDITERKKAEQELSDSEKKFRGVVENANDAIYIITPKGFEYVNSAFERLTGFTSEQVCGEDFIFWNK